ncbi:MAG: MBL fold metallo-hydrolase [Anaerolineales bacterium]|nr:MBL fold metallo-hydrolase [Anaerolineales bacterium]
MQRERVADDIYVFTSELYAQVTAGAVITPDGAILIDTLPYPEETREIKDYIEQRLKVPVRFVVNTHYHADHSYGTCLFPNAVIVGHALCRELLDTSGRKSLEKAQAQANELEDLYVVLPEIIFESGCLNLHLGDKTVKLLHAPGHSNDSVMALIPEDRVLFAADTLMPVPTMIDGDIESLISSLRSIIDMPVDNVVQGHGEVILRGEIKSIVEGDIKYLRLIEKKVARLIDRGGTVDELKQIDIESCGKSRIPLNGLVTNLHYANLYKLYRDMVG